MGINRQLEVLRSLFNWAIKRKLYRRESPFLENGQPTITFAKEAARERRLQGDEEARLIREASPHLKALIIAALDTGMRRGELLNLQWRDVVQTSKGHTAFFVLGEPIDSVKTAWRATCRRAGIADLNFHDLRREHGAACWREASTC